MSSPQLEKGYTRIANELLERIIAGKFTKNQLAILLGVVRKTYGFNKKQDLLTVTMLANMAEINRAHASRAFHELIHRRALLVEQHKSGLFLVSVNKNYDEWGVPKAHARTKSARGAYQKRTGGVPKAHGPRTKSARSTVPKPHTQKTGKDNSKDNLKDNQQKTLCGGGETPPAPTGKSNGAKKPKEPGRTKETWAAYAMSYLRRYGVEPTRNQTTSGQLAHFVNRVGHADAPHVAAYYVTLNQRWYVTKAHPVGVMLQDAEKLHMEWKTNRSITDTGARQADQTETNRNVFQKLLDEERAKHG